MVYSVGYFTTCNFFSIAFELPGKHGGASDLAVNVITAFLAGTSKGIS